MAKLTLIAGLPGSGKSTYIASRLYDVIFDDFFVTQPDGNISDTLDDNKDPFKNSRFYELIDALIAGKHAVVSDIIFCIPLHRNVFLGAIFSKVPNVELEYIFFENKPNVAKRNVQNRARPDRINEEINLINELSARYVPVVCREENIYDA